MAGAGAPASIMLGAEAFFLVAASSLRIGLMSMACKRRERACGIGHGRKWALRISRSQQVETLTSYKNSQTIYPAEGALVAETARHWPRRRRGRRERQQRAARLKISGAAWALVTPLFRRDMHTLGAGAGALAAACGVNTGKRNRRHRRSVSVG